MDSAWRTWEALDSEFLSSMKAQGYTPITSGTVTDAPTTFTGILAGAPIAPRPLAVLGINWGTSGASGFTWESTPLSERDASGLGDEIRSGPFGVAVTNLIAKSMNREFNETKRILEKVSFYSNRILVRTLNVSSEWEKLKTGAEVSARALVKMLAVVRPQTILCFGNGASFASPAHFVLHDLAGKQDWRYQGSRYPFIHGRKTFHASDHGNVRLTLSRQDEIVSQVWVFPHPARLRGGPWTKNPKLLDDLARALEPCLLR